MTSISPIPVSSTVGFVAPRIAVLIDGDNISRRFRPEIDRQARLMGNVVACQLFGDITLHSDWAKEAGIDIHHCAGKSGSNAADIALVIAALDLAYRGLAQAFLIVSNDRDFEPLRRHLLKIGCGAAVLKTPPKPMAESGAQLVPQPALQPEKAKAEPSILAQVKELIRSKGDAGGLQIARMNNVLSKAGFRVSDTPEKQWRAWLEARPAHFELDPKGPESRVRLVQAGKGGDTDNGSRRP